MSNITHKLVTRGNTRPLAAELKKLGWKWNPTAKHWYIMLAPAHADRVRSGDTEFLRGLGGRKKGCCTTLDGNEVFRSKSFGPEADTRSGSKPHADQDGFGWNNDQFGNPIQSRKIAGSSPDDHE